MIRSYIIFLFVCMLLLMPLTGMAQSSLPLQTEIAWQTFLEASPRDQQTKDFLELRIRKFIDHLDELEAGTDTGGATSLEVSRALNEVRRDYTMLEATVRNLKSLDAEEAVENDADLNLLVSIGEIFGQAQALAR